MDPVCPKSVMSSGCAAGAALPEPGSAEELLSTSSSSSPRSGLPSAPELVTTSVFCLLSAGWSTDGRLRTDSGLSSRSVLRLAEGGRLELEPAEEGLLEERASASVSGSGLLLLELLLLDVLLDRLPPTGTSSPGRVSLPAVPFCRSAPVAPAPLVVPPPAGLALR